MMCDVAEGAGRHAGARRAERPAGQQVDVPRAFALAAGITVCVVAWGYLVWAAIDFGTSARAGDSGAWLFLALACLGAIACLFVGLMLATRLGRALGLSGPGATTATEAPPRVPGGRRRAR